MNAIVCSSRSAAMTLSQAWIDAEGLGDVALAKYFVQKIPLNVIYYMDPGENQIYENYLFYPPHFNVIMELRQDADEINTRKLAKINNLEEQIKNIQENMSTVPEINTRRDI
jgi:hypothetical protein|tara:strand:- start:7359 stop:7694 length:336 start_codon:yes stop_codon:yes gene_type:complete